MSLCAQEGEDEGDEGQGLLYDASGMREVGGTKNLQCSSFVQANENGQDRNGGELVEMISLSGQGKDSRDSEVGCFHFLCGQKLKLSSFNVFLLDGGGYPGLKGCFMLLLGRFFPYSTTR